MSFSRFSYTLPALASNVEPWRGTLTDGGQVGIG